MTRTHLHDLAHIVNEDTAVELRHNLYRTILGVAYIDDVSFRKARIDLLLDIDTVESKKYMIYYQPMQSQRRVVPGRRIDTAPAQTLSPTLIATAQRYDSITKYKVHTGSDFDIWFAETTQKIAPDLAPPTISRSTINISSARQYCPKYCL